MSTGTVGRSFQILAASMGLLFSGCGGGGDTAPSRPKGAMSVTLVDGPSSDYRAINLNVQSVQVHQSASAGESGWLTLSTPNRTIDLLSLQGGVVETLAAGQTLDAGSYQMLRLVLGSGNTLTLSDGSTADLSIPSGLHTGLKIPLSFSVQAGTTADVWVDFDGAHSIQVHDTGSRRYILRPVIRGVVKVATGSVSGSLTGPAGAPLPGAMIMAESVDASGNVTILRSGFTRADGSYTLDLLPIGQTFFVVSQPVVGSAVYEGKASDAVTLTSTSATATVNLTFSLALGVGALDGALTPMATVSQSDAVYLMQTLATGSSGSKALVVGSVNAVVGASAETYALASLPSGTYQVQGLRSTVNADGSTTVSRSPLSASFTVSAALTSHMDIAF